MDGDVPSPDPHSGTVRALITGAGGFVGLHLQRHLEALGDEVIATDRATDGLDVLDAPALLELFRRATPEVVYHLAGASDVGGSWSTPQATFRANAEGTLNVLWAAREAGTERVLTIGSADVYGKVRAEDLPISEDLALRPVSPYAASKVAADSVALQANLGFGQQVVRARPFNHLGPGQTDRFVAPALAPARWYTTSGAARRNSSNRAGASSTSSPSVARSVAMTSSPCASRWRCRCSPTNPPAPVTSALTVPE